MTDTGMKRRVTSSTHFVASSVVSGNRTGSASWDFSGSEKACPACPEIGGASFMNEAQKVAFDLRRTDAIEKFRSERKAGNPAPDTQ